MHSHGEEATAEAVLRLWDQAAELDGSDLMTHVYRARLQRELGQLGLAGVSAQFAVDAAVDDRGRIIALAEVGAVANVRGQLELAVSSYAESLDIARRLAQRDLAVGLVKVADVLLATGDVTGALAHHRESLEILRRLALVDTASAIARRDVWVSMWRLANMSAPGGISWADVTAKLVSIRSDGLLAPVDQRFLAEAHQRALSGTDLLLSARPWRRLR
jgi:hypothetical protein